MCIFLVLLLYGQMTRIALVIYDVPCAFKPCISEINNNNRLGRMVTYLEGLLPIELHDPLITWPLWGLVVFWKSISLLSQYLWTLNLTGYWLQGVASARKCLSYHKRLVPVIKNLRKMYLLLLQLFTSRWLWKYISPRYSVSL